MRDAKLREYTLSISQERSLPRPARKLGQLLVWEWQSESYILKQQGHYFDMNTFAYAPDGQIIVTGGDDGKVKIWSTYSGFCFVTFRPQRTHIFRGICKARQRPLLRLAGWYNPCL